MEIKMKTRIITALAAILVFIAVILLPQACLVLAIGLICLFMAYECTYAMDSAKEVKIFIYIGIALLYIGIIADVFVEYTSYMKYGMYSLIVFMLMFMALAVKLHGNVNCKDIFSAAFVALYITFTMSFITRIRIGGGLFAMLTIFISAWATDTGAYFAGSFFGKHKLIPNVSPNKTVEGAIGGVLLSVICCTAYLAILNNSPIGISIMNNISYSRIIVMSLVTSVCSQLGDLAASALKRDSHVKDYGKIFPGHGGFMDRFDSVMYIAPIVYLLLMV